MPDDGFGSELWKNVRAVTFGADGEIQAPVRADGHEGIVVGVDQVAESHAQATRDSTAPKASKVGRPPGWWARLTRR